MSILYQPRGSDSYLVETITTGFTTGDGAATRPAEVNWHMVLSRRCGQTRFLLVGPWVNAGKVHYEKWAELLWIRFKAGVFMPHLTTNKILNSETVLPEGSNRSFWLHGSTWELPNFDNADTFVDKLMREGILAFDPVVAGALEGQRPDLSPRTIRHRFLQAAGLPQTTINRVRQAQHAADLLRQGTSILDTVHDAGYFDQPHLTRSLRQFIGCTPTQLLKQAEPESVAISYKTVPA